MSGAKRVFHQARHVRRQCAQYREVSVVGTDRIAVHHGSNLAIMASKIFEQEQLARAAEMGSGVRSPDRIDLVTADAESRNDAGKLKEIPSRG